jgi:glycosyltransferase involved in cell wall biosynthesis
MKGRAVFFWDHFADYHVDRCRAVKDAGQFGHVQGMQVAGASDTYAWVTEVPVDLVSTLFDGGNADRVSKLSLCLKMIQASRKYDYVFLCNYDRPEIFLVGLAVRLSGRTPIIMFDSKFDDKPRFALREILKSLMLKVYAGALVSGDRSEQYLRYLGFKRPITQGYDTVDAQRISKLSARAPLLVPAITFVGRFVKKKNVEGLIEAYRRYCEMTPQPLPLRLVGDGPCRPAIETLISRLNKGSVEITGFVDQQGVAQAVGSAAVIVQPSTEEQWGLVINEAVALGKPVISSVNVGANDTLLFSGQNGFMVHPHDADGMAKLMQMVCHSDWRIDPLAAARARELSDVPQFAAGVHALIDAVKKPQRLPI